MTVNIDGLNIEYTEEGSGQAVLLLHGCGSSFEFYKGIRKECCNLVWSQHSVG